MGITAIGTGGFFTCFSHVTPLLNKVSWFESNYVIFILALICLGMIFGNYIGEKLTDQISRIKTTIFSLFIMVIALLAIVRTASHTSPPPPLLP
ncbi:MAG: hypothetical protein ABI045_02620 [Flavobacteriales bacterium]